MKEKGSKLLFHKLAGI